MTAVGLCTTLSAYRRRSFHRSVVAPGTTDIYHEILGSCHACLSVGDGHIGGRFYCSSGYPGIIPPLVLPPGNRGNFREVGIVGPRADSDPCIWAIPVGVFGRFGVGVAGSPRFLPHAYAG